ncbi:IS1 family transposase [Flavobacterium microcysteis]|uniref:IS1 family transposase n=1 Tax=Flavobacterium microcysteis TaxID=2596891 RepID=A0A501QN44_9FLAO|nr:IS1 family transposase [Flavobacterium microcysteis]TPD73661.1 IS1 family transposase [Flavobacterium microcysteis]
MAFKPSSCTRCVGDCVKIIKYGKTKSGNQRFICKICGKTKVEKYIYKAYCSELNDGIVLFTKEGLGIRSTARVLKISTTTLLRRIVSIAQNIKQPIISMNKIYEVDEIKTYIRRKDKLIWIVYALERETRKIINFHIGRRTNNTLNVVLKSVTISNPLAVFTDKLKHYRYLIDKKVHKTKRFGTNHIERMNLSLRTHLKRLNRRTICFSRSKLVLVSILKIYFWI